MDLGPRLLDDAGALTAGAEVAVDRWLHHRRSAYADLVGALLVPDTALVRVGRAAVALGAEVEVAAVVSGGAGGLLALGRPIPGVRLTAAYATLRDLDDLAGNARRVVAAATQLDGIEVAVGLPFAPRWEVAVDEVEAAGLLAALAPGPRLAEQLSVLIEADLPYRVGPGTGGTSITGLLAATAVVVEDGDVTRAGRVLVDDAEATVVRQSLPADFGPRLRRRLRSVAVDDVAIAATALTRWA